LQARKLSFPERKPGYENPYAPMNVSPLREKSP
jgi:hypothetical protein